jgi:hypothetical protein
VVEGEMERMGDSELKLSAEAILALAMDLWWGKERGWQEQAVGHSMNAQLLSIGHRGERGYPTKQIYILHFLFNSAACHVHDFFAFAHAASYTTLRHCCYHHRESDIYLLGT